jgi:hypothetical protein
LGWRLLGGNVAMKILPAEQVRDISEAVYRLRLNQESGDGADERMIAEDGDNGAKLRNRAAAYDSLTRAYLKVMGDRL